MLTFLSVSSPFPTERDVSIRATVALTQKLESYKFQCLVHTAREAQTCEQSIEMYIYSLGKSSNRSLGNFNILGQINNIQKSLFFREMYFILEMIYQIIILIDQFTQLPSREKDGYPNSVKSLLIIQFLVLKLKKITETLVFSEKDKFIKM